MKNIKEQLQTKWLGQHFLYLESVDSTNDFAHARGEDGAPQGFVVAAGAQMAGRGRKGREWCSPYEDGLWFSLLLRPEMSPKDATALTLVTAVGISRGFDHYAGVNAAIKWPNDLLADGGKLCGILSEMKAEPHHLHYVVIGIGVNLRTTALPSSVKETAVGLEEILGHELDKSQLLCTLLQGLESAYDDFFQGGFEELRLEWAERSMMLGKTVTVKTPKDTLKGKVIGISKEGFLRVALADGKVAQVISGDVTMEA